MSIPRVALVGIGGYGRVHLRHLLDFHRRGELVLAAAVAFPPEPDEATLAEIRAAGCVVVPSFGALQAALPALGLQLAVVPTPIHLHARMTIALLHAGVDVLVEKPLTATESDAAAIIDASRATGRMVAVGFQYLHAPEVRALKARLLGGAIGPLRRLVVHGAWPRSHAYYRRNHWAGRVRVDHDWVLDSPVSNAMSHFLMVMLFLAGSEEAGLAIPAFSRAELYRAQAIESFDTAVLQLQTSTGLKLDFYGTHSSREVRRPSLQIEGAWGQAEWIQDGFARLSTSDSRWEHQAQPESEIRERMLRDVLARRSGQGAFVCTPEMAAVHVRCFAGLDYARGITPIPGKYLATQVIDGETFTFVPGIEELLAKAAFAGESLASTGAPWARAE